VGENADHYTTTTALCVSNAQSGACLLVRLACISEPRSIKSLKNLAEIGLFDVTLNNVISARLRLKT